jgi:hypothetical protein
VDWQYEDEWRLIEEIREEFTRPAPLVEFVFGLKMSLEEGGVHARESVGFEVRFS